jgi:hypothetical protein
MGKRRKPILYEPFKGLATNRRPLTAWERHSLIGFCVSAFQFLARGKGVDLNNVRKALPALRKFMRDEWKIILAACVVCRKPVRPGTGKKTDKGWNVHRICAAREDL